MESQETEWDRMGRMTEWQAQRKGALSVIFYAG